MKVRFTTWLILMILCRVAFSQNNSGAGSDGPAAISGTVNTYYSPSSDVVLVPGAQSVSLTAVASKDPAGTTYGINPVQPGDRLLIIQMQDAEIAYSNNSAYGSGTGNSGPDALGGTGFSHLNNTGKYEYVVATSAVPLSGGILTFEGSGPGSGTIYTYKNLAATATCGRKTFQVIRVPRYSAVNLLSDISAPAFNGRTGGIIAFDVAGTMNMNGFKIDASGKGFRGGYGTVGFSGPNLNDLYVALSSDTRSTGKGEGIAGTPRFNWDGFNRTDNGEEGLPGGSYGRGSPANAGGGGNDHNAGGGGGGNGGYGGEGGRGQEGAKGTYPSGGRPGSSLYPVSDADITRLTMGGGGGGGDANNSLTGVPGGAGGGIILINAGRLAGTGTFLANGAAGQPGVFADHPDGAGGGGAGGTIFVNLLNPDCSARIHLEANGGQGGNTENDSTREHGPGGGGGAGFVYYHIACGTVSISAEGGNSGITDSGKLSPHYAQNGSGGVSKPFTIPDLPEELLQEPYPELYTSVSEEHAGQAGSRFSGRKAVYIIKVFNAGKGRASEVEITGFLPAKFYFTNAEATYSGKASGPRILSNSGTVSNPQLKGFDIPPGDTVTIRIEADIDCSAVAGVYHASAQSAYPDPTRTKPDRIITAALHSISSTFTVYDADGKKVPGANYDGQVSSAIQEDVYLKGRDSINVISANSVKEECGSTDAGVLRGSAMDDYSFQWQVSADSLVFSDISGANEKDYDPPVLSKTARFRRVAVSFCDARIVSNVLEINVIPQLTNNRISADQQLCAGSAAGPLTGSLPSGGTGAFAYQWQSSADSLSFADIAGATGRDYDPGTISVSAWYRRVVSSGACMSLSPAVKISILPAITNNVIASDQNVCVGTLPELIKGSVPSDTTGLRYLWESSTDLSRGFIPAAGINDQRDYLPGELKVCTWFRRLVISSCGSLESNRVRINVVAAPEPAFAGKDQSLINTNTTLLNARVPAEGKGVWSQVSGPAPAVFADLSCADTRLRNLVAGTYFFRWTVSNNSCNTSSDEMMISVKSIPVANNDEAATMVNVPVMIPVINNDLDLYGKLDPASVVIVSEPENGSLKVNANGTVSYLPNPGYTGPGSFRYTVQNTDGQISNSARVLIMISPPAVIQPPQTQAVPALNIPEGFSPNHDGVNDQFVIANPSGKRLNLSIYNRWGDAVYKSENYQNDWDGRCNQGIHINEDVPDGTYFYVLIAEGGERYARALTINR